MPPSKLTQTETRPKAKTETRPTALNEATRTAKGQCQRTANLAHEASYLSKPFPTPGQTDIGHETLTSGSWPMPKHCHPKALADSTGQIRHTANLTHEANYLSKPCPTPGQTGEGHETLTSGS